MGSHRISGTVTAEGRPARCYVRLLDRAGEFVAEVPTSKEGRFTFFAGAGDWTIRVISAADPLDHPISLGVQDSITVEISL